jgi:hypothetical protein
MAILTYDRVFPAATPADQREESFRAAREGRKPRIFMQRKDMQQQPNFPALHGFGLIPDMDSLRSALGHAMYSAPSALAQQQGGYLTPATMARAITPSSIQTAQHLPHLVLPSTAELHDAGFVASDPLIPTGSGGPSPYPDGSGTPHPYDTALPPAKAPSPWYTQPLGMAAIGIGGLVVGAGAYMLLRGGRKRKR